jgi:hypothetical protein
MPSLIPTSLTLHISLFSLTKTCELIMSRISTTEGKVWVRKVTLIPDIFRYMLLQGGSRLSLSHTLTLRLVERYSNDVLSEEVVRVKRLLPSHNRHELPHITDAIGLGSLLREGGYLIPFCRYGQDADPEVIITYLRGKVVDNWFFLRGGDVVRWKVSGFFTFLVDVIINCKDMKRLNTYLTALSGYLSGEEVSMLWIVADRVLAGRIKALHDILPPRGWVATQHCRAMKLLSYKPTFSHSHPVLFLCDNPRALAVHVFTIVRGKVLGLGGVPTHCRISSVVCEGRNITKRRICEEGYTLTCLCGRLDCSCD